MIIHTINIYRNFFYPHLSIRLLILEREKGRERKRERERGVEREAEGERGRERNINMRGKH